MTSRILFYIIIVTLIVTGISILWMRHSHTGIPLLPGEQTPAWLIEARIDFYAAGRAVTVNFDIPDTTLPGFTIFSELPVAAGYGFSIIDDKGNRRGEWTIRHASGPQTLYYKVQVVASTEQKIAGTVPEPKPLYVSWNESEELAANQLLAIARERSSTTESMTRELIKLLADSSSGQDAALLLSETPLVQLLDKLLNYAEIPTRIVAGLYLEDGRRNQQLKEMIEVFTPNGWVLFNPETGQQGIPDNFLLWNLEGHSQLDVIGGRSSQVHFAMLRESVSPVQVAQKKPGQAGFAMLSVQSLPVEEQNLLRILLLLPVAALVLVFMRIIVGIETSGTFMPILIALSFLQTKLVPGLSSFIAIVAFGLLLRSYMSRLNLLLVARISTIVVIVVFIVIFFSIFGYQLGFNTGMTVSFFPIIIIAWTIERMSILWEDEGPWEVLVQVSGSLIVAVLAYLMMKSQEIQHLSFHFPEINLVVVALIMLMGNYTGYKLLELRRFRALRTLLRP
jgi:hypothetical protein